MAGWFAKTKSSLRRGASRGDSRVPPEDAPRRSQPAPQHSRGVNEDDRSGPESSPSGQPGSKPEVAAGRQRSTAASQAAAGGHMSQGNVLTPQSSGQGPQSKGRTSQGPAQTPLGSLQSRPGGEQEDKGNMMPGFTPRHSAHNGDEGDDYDEPEPHVTSADPASVPCQFLLARVSMRMGNHVSAPQTTWIAEVLVSYAKSAKIGVEYYGTLPFDVEKLPPSEFGYINLKNRTITYSDQRGLVATIRGIFPIVPWQNCIFIASAKYTNLTRRYMLSMRPETPIPKIRPRRQEPPQEKKGKLARLFNAAVSDAE